VFSNIKIGVRLIVAFMLLVTITAVVGWSRHGTATRPHGSHAGA